MADLNVLLKDFMGKRLAYKEINRQAHEALLTGIVEDIEALKVEMKARRGGRPPKVEEAA